MQVSAEVRIRGDRGGPAPGLEKLILSKRCRKSAIEAGKQGLRTVSTKSGRMDRERRARWSIQPVTTLLLRAEQPVPTHGLLLVKHNAQWSVGQLIALWVS